MEERERAVRKFVFDYLLERTTAPCVEEIALGLGLPVRDAAESLRRLDAAHHVKLLEGTGRLLMAFPFSAIATPYRVTRPNGRRYFANCAWDALAFHPMLGEPIRIDAFCQHCGTPIALEVADGRGTSDGPLPLVRLMLPAAEWWNDITRTCANTMVFLASEEHLVDPAHRQVPHDHGILTIDEVLRMSRPIYGGKLARDYERPTATVLQATYESIGLRGPYWRLG